MLPNSEWPIAGAKENVSLREKLCLLKMSRDLQTLFAAVKPQVEGLNLETLLMLKMETSLLSGYTETNSIHNRTTVDFFLKTLIRNKASRIFRQE
jgi:hypothetical protein